jgi:hypothetical protein
MVIIIGASPPNTLKEVNEKRVCSGERFFKDKKYWDKT